MKAIRVQSAIFLLVTATALILPVSATAATEAPAGGLSIINLGTQTTVAYFNTIEAPAASAPRNCLWGAYYVDISTFGGRTIYATLLSAQVSGKKLARLDWSYSGASPGQCMVVLVQLQD